MPNDVEIRDDPDRFESDVSSEDVPGCRVALLVTDQRLTAFAPMWARRMAHHLQAEVFSTASAAAARLGVEVVEGELPE
ncbi:MAG TPA: hypothetical protein VKA86_10015 [Candidatus Krumholzibacteria bacterium]|nr:hypothetical protein [Candidatus Krumholzibacteria bacterium]